MLTQRSLMSVIDSSLPKHPVHTVVCAPSSGAGPLVSSVSEFLLDNELLVGVILCVSVCECVCVSGVCPRLPSSSKERRQAALVCDGHI